jgi:Fuc2NAc and GlcNAc transferase
MQPDVLDGLTAFAVALVGVGCVLLYTRQTGLLDVPNHRSSHSVPTPRGGGIALIVAVVFVGGYEIWHSNVAPSPTLVFLVAAIGTLALVGWIDDRGSTRVGIRLMAHVLCGLAVAVLVANTMPLPLPLGIAWLAWWIFWTVASINIVNFMDGIDGMVATQGIVYGVFLFALLPASSAGSRYGLILAAACLGFLVWNWPPARMFMGDVGSGPLGLLFVIGGALAVVVAPAPLVFLPLFPLFLDALVTVVIRFRHGEKLTHAHRSHLYQRLANGGYGHARVTLIYALAATIGAVIALLVKDASASRIATAILVYVFLVLVGWMLLHERFAEAPITNQPPIADVKR